MTCYARPLAFLFLILGAAMIAAGMISTVAVLLAVIGVSALLGVVAVAVIFRVTTRRRASEGACTSCRYQCQAMQLYLAGMEDRQLPVLVFDEPQARWPDRPATRSRTGASA